MTNSDSNRLDRIEAILEAIAARAEEYNNRIDSNARAIEALVNEQRESEQRAKLDRERLYGAMAELATAQANLASTQASFYGRLTEQDELIRTLSRRQGEIVQILKILGENR
ncbi:MAG: hypothetical protein MUD14_24550 [Hydrococcus sp. Prado102]|jgi:hypothetical protein|nr:hypothetical protein [Hydrococcus sp. Prado102]